MLQAVTELWGQFYHGGNSMEKVGWQVPEPCFAWVWDSGLPSWWSPALVWDEHLWLPTSNMVLLMFFPSNSTLCEIQKCYFAVKFWHRKPSTQNQQPTSILHWCVSKEKPNPWDYWLFCSQRALVFPLPQWHVPPGGKRAQQPVRVSRWTNNTKCTWRKKPRILGCCGIVN